jgi:PIN domain nuclease of toxin-antitoxin system
LSLVLDTHAWIWFINADSRLGPKAKEFIERAIATDGAVISAITPWEVAMLVARGRLALNQPVGDWLTRHVSGFVLHPLSVRIAVDSSDLPDTCHGDPADRIIIATSRHLDAPLMTADGKILTYGRGGHVATIDAAA